MKNKGSDVSGPDAHGPAPWVIALCADWCSQCHAYRATFTEVARAYPSARFFWIDVEDEDDIAGELDIQTFPTVMVIEQSSLKFFGPLTSQPGVLDRVLQGVLAGNASPGRHEAGTQELLRGLMAGPARLASFEICGKT